MRTLLVILLVFTIACGGTAFAKKKHKGGITGTITEVNALNVTISVGNDGNLHDTYKITPATKVTLDGAPAKAGDLLAGMVANIKVTDDGVTVSSIVAHDPKGKRRGR